MIKKIIPVMKYKIPLICLLIFLVGFFTQLEYGYADKTKRDPFIALVTRDGRILNLEPTTEEQKIILEGIYYDGQGESYAIINGEVVSAGEYILGYYVLNIKENKVTLYKDDKQVEFILDKDLY